MINLPETTKNQYKDYDRKLQVYGNLYLARKRPSNNFLNQANYVNLLNMTYSNGIFTQVQADTNNNPNFQLQAFNGNTYVSLLGEKRMNDEGKIIYFSFTKTSSFNRVRYKINGSQRDTGVMLDVSNLTNNKQYYIGATFTNKTQGSVSWREMYINENNGPYEEYGISVIDYNVDGNTSNNFLNQKNQVRLMNSTYSNGVFMQAQADTNNNSDVAIQKRVNGSNTDTIAFQRIKLGLIYFEFIYDGTYNEINYKVNGSQRDTGVTFDVSHLTVNQKYYIGATFTDIEQGYISWRDMYINKDNGPYELYNSSPFKLTEENQCKILSYNINEKYDIYLTSLPYNEMTIEVDNENGYFTDYTQTSILSRLNNDCYVDLFIKINDDRYYKIMTMTFAEVVSTNYENAKLKFKSVLSKLTTLPIKDKDYNFFSKGNVSKIDIRNYFATNYGIVLENKWGIGHNFLIEGTKSFNDLQKMLLICMYYLTFITTNYNNDVVYKLVTEYERAEPTVEIISNDLQLERATIKKGRDYDILIKKYDWDIATESREYSNIIRGKLTTNNDTIVILPGNWHLQNLTSANITCDDDIEMIKHLPTNSTSDCLVLEISGEIGTEYQITINNQNVGYDYAKGEIIDRSYKSGSDYDESKKIVVNSNHPVNMMYYTNLFIINPIVSYVEVKCMGLPYLEIGDIIEVKNTLTTTITIVITDIDSNFDGGLTMTIKGYCLDWQDN